MRAEALSECEKRAKQFGLEYVKVQVSGDPVEEILKRARAQKSDCIVMGHMSLDRAEKLLVDSVSQEVLKRCDVPIIIVK